MEIRTCDLGNFTEGFDRNYRSTDDDRAFRIMEFVESLARYLPVPESVSSGTSVSRAGSMSLKKLRRPGGDQFTLFQGTFSLEESLRTQHHLFQLTNCDFQKLGGRYHLTTDSVEAIELSKFGGYGMYSLRHLNQEIEAVLYDRDSNKATYEIWRDDRCRAKKASFCEGVVS